MGEKIRATSQFVFDLIRISFIRLIITKKLWSPAEGLDFNMTMKERELNSAPFCPLLWRPVSLEKTCGLFLKYQGVKHSYFTIKWSIQSCFTYLWFDMGPKNNIQLSCFFLLNPRILFQKEIMKPRRHKFMFHLLYLFSEPEYYSFFAVIKGVSDMQRSQTRTFLFTAHKSLSPSPPQTPSTTAGWDQVLCLASSEMFSCAWRRADLRLVLLFHGLISQEMVDWACPQRWISIQKDEVKGV